MKNINRFLNILMGSFFGVFIGNVIYSYVYWHRHPEIYQAQSAPWYYSALPSLALFAAVVIVCVIIKLILRHREKKDR